MSDAFIGRQAIYDRSLNVFAFELLYRDGIRADDADALRGDTATANLMVNAFFDVGLESLVGDSLCFINLTSKFITGELASSLPPGRVVVQILDDVKATPEVMEGLAKLKSEGAQIALGEYEHRPDREPFLELADYVMINMRIQSPDYVASMCDQLSGQDLQLIASNVDTQEQQRQCKSLGFHFFQGFFLMQPEVIKNFKIPGNHIAQLELLTTMLDPNVDMDEISELISQDASMTYKLLRFANSATYAPEQPISGIGQMIMMLGLKAVRRVVSLMIMIELDDKPGDLLAHSLVRAKMCERMAEMTDVKDPSAYYTVGLLSTLDAITGATMASVMEQLPLAQDIQDALVHGKGDLGGAVNCVRAFERGNFMEANYKGLGACDLSMAYAESVESSREIWGAVPKREKKAA